MLRQQILCILAFVRHLMLCYYYAKFVLMEINYLKVVQVVGN